MTNENKPMMGNITFTEYRYDLNNVLKQVKYHTDFDSMDQLRDYVNMKAKQEKMQQEENIPEDYNMYLCNENADIVTIFEPDNISSILINKLFDIKFNRYKNNHPVFTIELKENTNES